MDHMKMTICSEHCYNYGTPLILTAICPLLKLFLVDSLSFINRLEKYSNPHIRSTWRKAWASKKNGLRTRFTKTPEALNEHAQPLMPLKVGDKVFIQNQTGSSPTKRHRTGTLVEVAGHDQYIIKVDCTGRLAKRNRFLRVAKRNQLKN